MIGSPVYMEAYSPHLKTKQMFDHILSFSDDAYLRYNPQHPYIGLAYNNKTLQLAAADEKNILIWSYFKLPPYKCTHIYPDEINYLSDDEFNFPEVALPD